MDLSSMLYTFLIDWWPLLVTFVMVGAYFAADGWGDALFRHMNAPRGTTTADRAVPLTRRRVTSAA